MISYIFKNKTKNILAIIFTILSILNSKIMYNIFAYAMARKFPLLSVFRLLPYILILIYLFTLKKEYRFKNYLFPAAFLIFAALNSYSFLTSLIPNVKYLISSEMVIWFVWTALYGLVVLAAYILCFLGAIKNFKNVRFLRTGMIALMVATLLSQVMEFVFVGGFKYFANMFQENSIYVYISMLRAVVKLAILLLFYFGIFNLTLNKKSEYIDITPFVDARKAKKEAKRAAKLEAKQQEEAYLNEPTPEIPDGSWRCMACGKILPDSIDRCECGYKK